jgi:hypothetical protein
VIERAVSAPLREPLSRSGVRCLLFGPEETLSGLSTYQQQAAGADIKQSSVLTYLVGLPFASNGQTWSVQGLLSGARSHLSPGLR